MIFDSVAGVIFSPCRSEVLLVFRRDVPVWVLPGGAIEPNEPPEDAIVREIVEETGFHVKIERLAGAYTPINRLARATYLYECSVISGKLSSSPETLAARFFSLDQLPPMPPPYRDWIEDAKAKGPTVHKTIDSVNYLAFCKNCLSHPLLVGRFLLSRLGMPFNSRSLHKGE